MTDFTPPPVSPLPGFLAEMVSSVARHSLTGLAGSLVAFGVFKANQTSEFVDLGVSVVLFGAALVWSGMQKKSVIKAVSDPNEAPH